MHWYYVSYNWFENDGTLIGTFSQSIYAESQEAAIKCAARGCSFSEDDNDDGDLLEIVDRKTKQPLFAALML